MANKDQQSIVLDFLTRTAEPLSLSEIMRRTGLSIPERTLRRWLSTWVEQGVITRVGQRKATRYLGLQTDIRTSGFGFLQGLDEDLAQATLKQIRDLWSHTSTAMEGNSLSLGDTHFLLEEGLTVSGKPIKDQQEVLGHARAIDLVYRSLQEPLSKALLFALHKAVLTEVVTDIYRPSGEWKVETNGTYALSSEGQQVFIEYAKPADVPVLMQLLIDVINNLSRETIDSDNAHHYYAKIHMGIAHIHPFWDGNGRIARLVANIPLLKAGLPPLVISQAQRRDYIQTLAAYQIAVGQLSSDTGVWPESATKELKAFEYFCESAYVDTRKLIDAAFEIQSRREQ